MSIQSNIIHVIDIVASCASGEASVDSVFPGPVGQVTDMDWDGEALVITSDRLYRTTTTLAEYRVYPFPVLGVTGVACQDDSISLICQGPPNPEQEPLSEFPIVTFKAPWAE